MLEFCHSIIFYASLSKSFEIQSGLCLGMKSGASMLPSSLPCTLRQRVHSIFAFDVYNPFIRYLHIERNASKGESVAAVTKSLQAKRTFLLQFADN